MRILYVADGRSPTAINWINHFVVGAHEVHLASTYPCDPLVGLASQHTIPVAFGRMAGSRSGARPSNLSRRFTTPALRTKIRQWLGPATLSRAASELRALINDLQPDIIHAMRIPFEGMLAAGAAKDIRTPLVVSVWGNDFTLHASSTPFMANRTRQTLRRADGLFTDTQRDQNLASQWGFSQHKPSLVLPGGGGIRPEIFHPPTTPVEAPVVINPRGLRAYIRNDTFFAAIPLVMEKMPAVRFLCPDMQGEPQAEHWAANLSKANAVELLPRQSRSQMADLYRQAQIAVSISEHDGTPNTLLEAMACGCFPIAGDIEPIREWLKPGENGLLVDPADPQALADAILEAMSQTGFRRQAAERNAILVEERADYGAVMIQAGEFYEKLVR